MRIPHRTLIGAALSLTLLGGVAWQVWAAVQNGPVAGAATAGGGTSANGSLEGSGSVGLPHAGKMQGQDFELEGGLWYGSDRVTAVDDPISTPRVHRLDEPYPNPFNPRTTVRFELASEAFVRIDIHDLRGRKVRTLARETRPGGAHSLVWNGTDDRGEAVASGTYHLRLSVDGQIQTRKLTLLK